MSASHLFWDFKQAAPGAGSPCPFHGGWHCGSCSTVKRWWQTPTAHHQLRAAPPFWSHWSNKPETITSFDFCFQVSFESEHSWRTAQAFASLPRMWTGQKTPAVQTRTGSPFFPKTTVVVGSSLMALLWSRAELILCPPAFGGSNSGTPWTAPEVRGGLEEVRVGSRSPSERIPAAWHNQHSPVALLAPSYHFINENRFPFPVLLSQVV